MKTKKRLRLLFDRLDNDHDHVLSAAEFKRAIVLVVGKEVAVAHPEIVQEVWAAVSVDGGGDGGGGGESSGEGVSFERMATYLFGRDEEI